MRGGWKINKTLPSPMPLAEQLRTGFFQMQRRPVKWVAFRRTQHPSTWNFGLYKICRGISKSFLTIQTSHHTQACRIQGAKPAKGNPQLKPLREKPCILRDENVISSFTNLLKVVTFSLQEPCVACSRVVRKYLCSFFKCLHHALPTTVKFSSLSRFCSTACTTNKTHSS